MSLKFTLWHYGFSHNKNSFFDCLSKVYRSMCLSTSTIFQFQGWFNHTKACSLCTFICEKYELMKRYLFCIKLALQSIFQLSESFLYTNDRLENHLFCIISVKTQLLLYWVQSFSSPSLVFGGKKGEVLQIAPSFSLGT